MFEHIHKDSMSRLGRTLFTQVSPKINKWYIRSSAYKMVRKCSNYTWASGARLKRTHLRRYVCVHPVSLTSHIAHRTLSNMKGSLFLLKRSNRFGNPMPVSPRVVPKGPLSWKFHLLKNIVCVCVSWEGEELRRTVLRRIGRGARGALRWCNLRLCPRFCQGQTLTPYLTTRLFCGAPEALKRLCYF